MASLGLENEGYVAVGGAARGVARPHPVEKQAAGRTAIGEGGDVGVRRAYLSEGGEEGRPLYTELRLVIGVVGPPHAHIGQLQVDPQAGRGRRWRYHLDRDGSGVGQGAVADGVGEG